MINFKWPSTDILLQEVINQKQYTPKSLITICYNLFNLVSYFLQHRPLCLASSSPRRKELLKKFNLEFDCYTPNIDEIPNKNEQAESFVKRMAI